MVLINTVSIVSLILIACLILLPKLGLFVAEKSRVPEHTKDCYRRDYILRLLLGAAVIILPVAAILVLFCLLVSMFSLVV